jgi:pimeloyl-ACP methyl ester carboxylesterase
MRDKSLRRILTAAALLGAGLTPARAVASPAGVVREARFSVVNTNTSRLPCTSDGRAYTVRGDLAIPQGGSDAVTLYLHGAAGNQFRYVGYSEVDPVYDFPAQMAERGQASLTLDMLGYGRTVGPADGNSTCTGSLADIGHQIVGELRLGNYSVRRGSPVAFNRVAIGGHSSGAIIAELEAYSYEDVDALVLLGAAHVLVPTPSADRAQLPYDLGRAVVSCQTGGDPDPERTNYATTFASPERMARDMFHNVDPEVREAFVDRRPFEPDPCGDRNNVGPAIALDEVFLQTINVPVLVVIGDNDFLSHAPGGETECPRSVMSPSCTFVRIGDTGHMLWLEKTVRALYGILDGWLSTYL